MSEASPRQPDHEIDPLFVERWSPRLLFTGEALPESELFRMLEAARWAPSAFNAQPWRFVYALRDTPEWDAFFDLLIPFNQSWVKNTGAILFIVSSETMKTRDGVAPAYSHSLDAGAAWANFALQATRQGWHAHGMTGFDKARAPSVLKVPEHHRVEAAIAVGRARPHDDVVEDPKRREQSNARRPITDFAFKGGFPPRDA